jgi:hypothetical protein
VTDRYSLYGSKHLGIRTVAKVLSSVLNMEFTSSESDFSDGEYWATPIGSKNVIQIIRNFVDEGLLYEEEFSEYITLVEIGRADNWDSLERRLSNVEGLDLLRREFLR